MTLPRARLCIGAAQVGSVLPSDIALYSALAQWVSAQGDVVLPNDQPACDILLAQWAQALREAGRLKTWRNELLSVAELPTDDAVLQGLPVALAQLERGAARVLGILTHAVHLVGFAADGRVWVQQRALNKATDPGLWDTLSGGLLSAGDDLHSGVLRETHEEAGLQAIDLWPLKLCGMVQQSRTVADGHILEAVWTYTATVKDGAVPHNLDGEAMGFACLSIAELTALVNAGQVTQEAVLALRLAGVLSL